MLERGRWGHLGVNGKKTKPRCGIMEGGDGENS